MMGKFPTNTEKFESPKNQKFKKKKLNFNNKRTFFFCNN